MPDTSQDQLSPEDVQALIHAQQHLYGSGDARAGKLYDYIVQGGYATRGAQGELQAKGTQPDAQMGTLHQPTSTYQAAPNETTPEGHQQAVEAREDANGPLGRFGIGLEKAGGTMLKPVGNLIDWATGNEDTDHTVARGTAQTAGKATGIAAQIAASAPAIAAAPVASAIGIGSGMAGGALGSVIGQATGLNPHAATLLSDVMGLGGGTAGAELAPETAALKSAAARFFPSLIDDAPENMLTRAIKPGKNNVKWNADISTALPFLKSAETDIGRPVKGVDDALEAVAAAKKSIWQQYQQRLGPAAQMGAQVDGNTIADAMINSVDKRTAAQNPTLLKRIQATADTYRRPMGLGEAEEFLQSANKDLNSYYAKNKVGQNVALNDPEISSTVAEAGALRDALYGKMDSLFGPGAAKLKQSYGSLSNVEKELYGRQLVAARQIPESLSEQLSTARGMGKIVKGIAKFDPSDIMEGVENTAVSKALKARNTSDAMIERAFAKAQPAQPFPQPTSPRLAGLLQRGPIQVPAEDASGAVPFTPPAYSPDTRAARLGLLLPEKSGAPTILPYNPQMSPGEQVSALMHMLRQMQQKSLPAKASPIQLPPPS